MEFQLPLEVRILLAAFATYRLAQFLPLDDGPFHVFLWVRIHVTPGSSLDTFVNCPYCQGVWFAALCAALVLLPTAAGNAALCALGLAGMQARLQGVRNG